MAGSGTAGAGAARRWSRRSLRLAAVLAGAALLLSSTSGVLVGLATSAIGPVVRAALHAEAPDIGAASTAPPSQTTIVLAGDGSTVGTFRPEELHVPLRPEDVPPVVADALVAMEDDGFWDHGGFDVPAAVRALLANTRAGDVRQGGSTLTQQLAKNLFTDGERTLARKFDELRLALAIEREHTKAEILTAYLNTTYFGEGALGAGAAARTYFRKPLQELTLGEAALLVGIIPSPSRWNPRRAAEVAERRRQLVLDRMASTDRAAGDELAIARFVRPVVHPPRRMPARYPFFLDYVRRWLIQEAGLAPDLVYRGGLLVETTLDPGAQDAAIRAVRAGLPHPHDPEGAAVLLDPADGQVRALVGGRDWERSQVNLALGSLRNGVGRQPGSSFKPFVLAAALEAGRSPAERVAAPAEFLPAGADKPVRNYTQRGYAPMSLAAARHRSVNTTYVALTEEVGPGTVAQLARDLGLAVPPPEGVGPSIGIGTYEVSPLGMAEAYAAFVRDGRTVAARPVDRVIVRATGEVVLDRTSRPPGRRVLGEGTARLVTQVLEGVVQRGTGRAAQLDRPVAGKTGTTDDYTNAWFVGYTPQLVAAVWVGFQEGAIPMRDIAGNRVVTGGSIPARVWRDVMAAAHAGAPVLAFAPAPDRPASSPPPKPGTPARPTSAPLPSTTTTTAAPPPPTTAPAVTTTTTTTVPPPPTTTTTTPPTTTTTTTTTTIPSTTTTTATTTTTTTTTAPPAETTTTTAAAGPSGEAG